MTNTQGKIVWIDGVEGVGKSTMITALSDELRKRHPSTEVVAFRFPNDGAIPVRDFLLSRDNHDDDIFAYVANILATIERDILPIVDRGGIVICDRSILSAFVLQLDGRISDITTILNFLDRPNTIWSDVSGISYYVILSEQVSIIQKRLMERTDRNMRDNLSKEQIHQQLADFSNAGIVLSGYVHRVMYEQGDMQTIISNICSYIAPTKNLWRRLLDGISRM